MIPTPLPLSETIEHPDVARTHRRDDCASMSACIHRAATEGWNSLSCVACQAYDEDPTRFVRLVGLEHLAPYNWYRVGPSRPVEPLTDLDVLAWGLAPRPIEDALALVVTAERTPWGTHHIVGWVERWEQVGREGLLAFRREVAVHPVGVAVCPRCAHARREQGGTLAPVQGDGWCPLCRAVLEAGPGGTIEYIPERSRRFEAQQRAQQAAAQCSLLLETD